MKKGIALQHLWTLLFGAILSLGSYAAPIAVPQLQARVMDLTNTLSAAQQSELESKLSALEQAKGSQLAVLIVPSTGDETIEQYGIRVADAWRLGRKGVDDGAILLVAKADRTVRIEVGRGLEGALPDVIASRIIRESIVPAFKAGDMVGGINAGVSAISAVIQGEALPEPSHAAGGQARSGSQSELPFILLVPLLVLGGVLRKAFGFFISFALSGGIAILGLMYFGLALPLAIAIGLFIGLFVGSNTGRGGAYLGGGMRGGGGFGGGGGFSGGGGGFGGGGASGRW